MKWLLSWFATVLVIIFFSLMLFYDTRKVCFGLTLSIVGGIAGAIIQTKNKK